MLHTVHATLFIALFILLLTAVISIAGAVFNNRADKEAMEVLASAELEDKRIIQQSDLEGLPICVQKWMERSGVIGKEKIHTVRLTQIGHMRLAVDKPWMSMEAVQYINVDKPGFVWKTKVKAAPMISMVGRDMYYSGHGSMEIKLMALVTLVNTKTCMELDQGTLQRYLAELMWYPTAALSDYITWAEIDLTSARATMTWQGVSASMVFNFNEHGDFVSNVTRRYREVNGKYILDDWGGIAGAYQEFNGIRIINQSDIVWKYKTGDFNWLQIELTSIEFNQKGLFG